MLGAEEEKQVRGEGHELRFGCGERQMPCNVETVANLLGVQEMDC